MSYARKRHASMMESQKKAAEEAAESLLAATASVARGTATVEPAAVAAEPAAVTHTQAAASVQHDDFAEDSSDDDSEAGGIAFLQAASAGAKKAKVPTAKASTPTGASSTNINVPTTPGSANNTAGGSNQSAPGVVSMQRMHWTKEMDALLLHIVPIYDAKDWVSIAKHMGGDVTNEQCRNRWCCKVDPSLNACKSGPWEPEEENRMRELIQQYTNHPEQDKRGRRRYRDSVHWGAVAKELNRSQKDCRSKWTTMQRSVTIQDMKKGPFTPEEDAVLLQRVAEWGDKGQGIWKALEQELGRPSNNIGNRYRKLLKTYHTGQPENSPVAAEDQAPDYLEVDSERKLAVALAPAISAAQAASDVEAPLRDAAVAAAAVLAGKKRGRPRINPLPLSLEDPMDGPSSSRGYVGRNGKRSKAEELAEAMQGGDASPSHSASAAASLPVHALAQGQGQTGASSSSSSAAGSAPPAPGMPVNASAELAAGRTKIGRSSFWNEERDALLVEAVQLYGKDWNKISGHVGEGANSDRCWQRWNRYLRPEAMICKTDAWTTEELIKLEELVLTHINNPHKRRAGRSTSRTTIDWTSISQLMGRTYMDCKGKWKKIKAFNMKKGPFTEEEDALIQQQLAELGIPLDGGDAASLTGEGPATGAGAGAGSLVYPSGFWEELSALLNRPPEILRARVRNLRNRAVVL